MSERHNSNSVLSQWLVHEHVDATRAYKMTVGAGLHLGAAIATMRTDGTGIGRFEFNGAGLSCIRLDADHEFATELEKGESRTIGLHLSANDESLADPDTAYIWKALAHGQQARATFRAPPGLIARLCAPIDPWFSGEARKLAMESRQIELKAMVLAWFSEEHGSRINRHHAFARKAREIIEDNPGAPITIAALAREVGLNARSLTAAFRAAYNVSITDYVVHCRLEHALNMLMAGATVAQVAHRVGYTPAHFSVAFRRRFGVIPSSIGSPPDID